jgi:hypothetical protein
MLLDCNFFMEYRHQILAHLIGTMPQELKQKIILDYLRAMKNTTRPAQKLQWVVDLGRGWMGLEAYKLLLEAVTIWDIEDADSFITSGEPTSFLGRLFNTDTAGNFTTPFGYVKSLYLAFDFSHIDLTATRPFLHAFPLSLGLFHDLYSFSFNISNYDFNKTFYYITSLGLFPPSLKVVRMISSSTRVRMMLSDVAGADIPFRIRRSTNFIGSGLPSLGAISVTSSVIALHLSTPP